MCQCSNFICCTCSFGWTEVNHLMVTFAARPVSSSFANFPSRGQDSSPPPHMLACTYSPCNSQANRANNNIFFHISISSCSSSKSSLQVHSIPFLLTKQFGVLLFCIRKTYCTRNDLKPNSQPSEFNLEKELLYYELV